VNELEIIEMKRALAGTAEILAQYVRDLEEQGFSRREAIRIATGWQAAVFNNSAGGGEDKE
jgi:hypothetical protein